MWQAECIGGGNNINLFLQQQLSSEEEKMNILARK